MIHTYPGLLPVLVGYLPSECSALALETREEEKMESQVRRREIRFPNPDSESCEAPGDAMCLQFSTEITVTLCVTHTVFLS